MLQGYTRFLCLYSTSNVFGDQALADHQGELKVNVVKYCCHIVTRKSQLTD